MEGYNEIYPQLPEDTTTLTRSGENFRLQQASHWLAWFENELGEREKIYKKYNRARSILVNMSTGSGVLSFTLSAGGLGTGLTGVGLPVAVSLGALGGICAVVSVITGVMVKSISKNVTKHEKTVSVCQAKLSTINDIVSKDLEDDKRSAEEFRLIKSEVEKYHEMKRSIRKKYISEVKNEAYKGPTPKQIKKMEDHIRADMLKKLGTA